MTKVASVISEAGEDYALVQDNNLQGEVLDRIYNALKEENIVEVTPEQEVLLVHHFAKELEAELAPRAQSVLERLNKIKKLGILPNDKSGAVPGTLNQDPNSESLDSDALTKAASLIRDKKSSKFITNETTVSSKPIPRQYGQGRPGEDAIQQALRAMEGK